MIETYHDTAPLTPLGHPNYRPYDATRGKFESLHGRAHCCPACERRFETATGLRQHCLAKHTGQGA